VTLLPFFWRL